ncbi:MAG: TPM domain-containing protein [Bacteroidota bacterium]
MILLPTVAWSQVLDVIPPVQDLVVDRAGLLAPSEAQALRQDLLAYERETSTQIVVVTLRDIGGADPGRYATELGQTWGVGRGDVDNGAVLLVVSDTRQVYIATGFGLEGAVPDALAGRIVRNVIVPAFRQGDFYAGLQRAVDAIQAAAAGEYEPVPEAPEGEGVNVALIYLGILLAYFVISGLLRGPGGGGSSGGRRRRRSGPGVVVLPGGFGGSGYGGGGFGGGGFGGFGGGGFGGGGFGGGGFGGGGFGGGGAGGSW